MIVDRGGTTFRMDNGQGGQRIADKQWLPQLHCPFKPGASPDGWDIYIVS